MTTGFEYWLSRQSADDPAQADAAAVYAELERLRARVPELEQELRLAHIDQVNTEAELREAEDRYDELLADCGGVSSPPWVGGPPSDERRAG